MPLEGFEKLFDVVLTEDLMPGDRVVFKYANLGFMLELVTKVVRATLVNDRRSQVMVLYCDGDVKTYAKGRPLCKL